MSGIKLLMVALVLGVIEVSTNNDIEMMIQHSDQCRETLKVDATDLKILLSNEFKKPTDKIKKHVLCIMVRCRIMTKDGKFNRQVAVSKIPASINFVVAFNAIEYCSKIGGKGPEDIAWNIFKCGFERKDAIFGDDYFDNAISTEPNSSIKK